MIYSEFTMHKQICIFSVKKYLGIIKHLNLTLCSKTPITYKCMMHVRMCDGCLCTINEDLPPRRI